MTDMPPPPAAEAATGPGDPLLPAKLIYGLYAIGYAVAITTLVGVVYAYIARGRHPVLDTHLTFQIRTFWISLLIAVLAVVTMVVGLGFLIWAFLAVWGVIRVLSGFLLANDGKPVTGTKYWGMMAF
ncbi:MAG: DUF4870 family protein [Paracoccus sp. (in: a-proteobacteria)]|jgi:uncharacterized membrane protein|uniref:DUF4870 family protein n=3 Tax=Paracoccus TaxID=265 RepID=UPI00237191CE|nr:MULTISPECIES: hypothetical protein [unclassified Paracoccus (in: a-proteobacteria)]MDB2551842.1 hypothetical protein [Paracoccus sp. (in: a-proteobacteria)]|tara:strand:- start:460 stop:840 length:381 start_codon:yes stop_codon:yes gene_type:complete